jgi:hypothetical protein
VTEDNGRVPDGTGLSPSVEPASGFAATRFDPSRKTSPWTFRWFFVDMHAARAEAERCLVEFGFSVGRRQRGSPSGILLGDFDIQKWRNLRPHERAALHGTLQCDYYPVTARFPASTIEVDDALTRMNDAMMARDRDRSGEAGETGTGSTEGNSPGPKDIAR